MASKQNATYHYTGVRRESEEEEVKGFFSDKPISPDTLQMLEADSTLELQPPSTLIDPRNIEDQVGISHFPEEKDESDTLLEPSKGDKMSSDYVKGVWSEKPIRRLALRKENNNIQEDYIRILRHGGAFGITYKNLKKARVHVRVEEDLTQLLWTKPKKKRGGQIEVCEVKKAILTEGSDTIVLTMRFEDKEMMLTVLPENSVNQLIPGRSLDSLQAKAKVWHEALEKLVEMKLQPNIYQ